MDIPSKVILPILCILVMLSSGSAQEVSKPASAEKPITAEQRDHWAFRPLSRPPVPVVRNTAWPRNAIDRFILHRAEEAGLSPAPAADRFTLIRRLTFDLTGLPPKPADVDAFVKDRSPNAYDKLVDRLLGSPDYGERWAQMWLDLARFAETDGFEHDKVRKRAWRYRDWVIRAMNADLPYDRFLQDQLAADQLRPEDDEARDALGLLLCGSDMPDINVQAERRHSFMNDMTATVGSVTMGLQFGCAQCHDHKFDPVSQRDFYRLRAFFDPYFKFTRYKPASLRTLKANDTVPASHLMIRGDYRRKGEALSAKFPRIAVHSRSRLNVAPSQSIEHRRASLAKWLTQPDHVLTTRVLVNRLWQAHFDRALAESTSDFGIMGDEPTHPDLLDWLATELPRRGWSLKALHRLIVTSATYRQASSLTVAMPRARSQTVAWRRSLKQDPDNRLWTRMPRRRLFGEALRDAMLAVSGSLSGRRGGPGVRPPLPKEMLKTLLKNQWPVSPDERDHRRRSIYLFVRRNLRYPIFAAFDKPDQNLSCPRRNLSTTAPQSLMLLNSRFSLDSAQRLARFAVECCGESRERQIHAVYRAALGRQPTADETATAGRFLAATSKRLRAENVESTPEVALTDFCLVLFNLNEFIYID